MAGPTPRQLAREDTLRRIKALAWEQLAEGGAGEVSLRAIARELNLVSSAIYRYYASRGDLITDLIIDAYNELADVLTAADSPRRTPGRRWRDVCFALRAWAIEKPHRFSLIYGTTIPGYRAPLSTVGPFARVVVAFCAPAAAAVTGQPAVTNRVLSRQLTVAITGLGAETDVAGMLALAGAFAQVIGLVSLEVGGAFVGIFEPADSLYAALIERECSQLGL